MFGRRRFAENDGQATARAGATTGRARDAVAGTGNGEITRAVLPAPDDQRASRPYTPRSEPAATPALEPQARNLERPTPDFKKERRE